MFDWLVDRMVVSLFLSVAPARCCCQVFLCLLVGWMFRVSFLE